eukprot:1302465-Pleurochrysis_carterae.AAC.1
MHNDTQHHPSHRHVLDRDIEIVCHSVDDTHCHAHVERHANSEDDRHEAHRTYRHNGLKGHGSSNRRDDAERSG